MKNSLIHLLSFSLIVIFFHFGTTPETLADQNIRSYETIQRCHLEFFKKKKRRWKKFKRALKVGAKFRGRFTPNARYIRLIFGKRKVRILADCVREAEKKSPFESYLSLSVVSWQQDATLTSSTGTVFPLLATSFGICVGGGWRYSFNSWLDGDLGGCGYAAIGDLANSNGKPSPPGLTYRAETVRGFGLFAGASILGVLTKDKVSAGFTIPLLLRTAPWPVPDSGGFALDVGSPIATGFLITTRLGGDTWQLSSKIGFIGSTSTLIWLLGMDYHL